jgi:hypothetical protein
MWMHLICPCAKYFIESEINEWYIKKLQHYFRHINLAINLRGWVHNSFHVPSGAHHGRCVWAGQGTGSSIGSHPSTVRPTRFLNRTNILQNRYNIIWHVLFVYVRVSSCIVSILRVWHVCLFYGYMKYVSKVVETRRDNVGRFLGKTTFIFVICRNYIFIKCRQKYNTWKNITIELMYIKMYI